MSCRLWQPDRAVITFAHAPPERARPMCRKLRLRLIPTRMRYGSAHMAAVLLVAAVVRRQSLIEVGIGRSQRWHGPHLGAPVAARLGFRQHLEARGIAACGD